MGRGPTRFRLVCKQRSDRKRQLRSHTTDTTHIPMESPLHPAVLPTPRAAMDCLVITTVTGFHSHCKARSSNTCWCRRYEEGTWNRGSDQCSCVSRNSV